MSLFEMVERAVIRDIGGEIIGPIKRLDFTDGRMTIFVDAYGEAEDDPDGGEELDDDEEDKEPLQFPREVASGGGGSGG